MGDIHWREAIEKAEQCKAIGLTDIFIYRSEQPWDRPWEFVTTVEPDGSHRLGIQTDVRLEAEHPCGLRFRWLVQLEKRGSNGSEHYQIDIDGIRKALSLLPMDARHKLQAILTNTAGIIEEKSQEQWVYLQQQFRDAATLRVLGDARTEPAP